MPGNNSGFLSSVTVLKRAFEIATSQTQVSTDIFGTSVIHIFLFVFVLFVFFFC
jgi:heme/copper-type cytochrome/quinol oxidase subunit 2